MRSGLAREVSYGGAKVAAFEKKLAELMEKAKTRPVKAAQKAEPKAAEPKGKKGKAKTKA